MKPWKLLLGVAGACAACCALPLMGGAVAAGVTSSALFTCAGELMPAAWVAAALALGAGGVWLWRRRLAGKSSTRGCNNAAGCTTQ